MAIVNGLIGVAHVIPSFLFLKSKWSRCIEETIIAIKQSALIFTFSESFNSSSTFQKEVTVLVFSDSEES